MYPSEYTAKDHLKNPVMKLGAESRGEVVAGFPAWRSGRPANEKAGTRVEFQSVAEAKKAGMKACEDCKP